MRLDQIKYKFKVEPLYMFTIRYKLKLTFLHFYVQIFHSDIKKKTASVINIIINLKNFHVIFFNNFV